jgi:hypothetical protein
MATVERYENADGTTLYMVRYRQPNNVQTKRRGFTTKRDAEAFAATVEVDKMRGDYVAPALGRVTVDQLGPAWLHRKQQHTAPSHYRTLETAWRVHVAPVWGPVPVADIDTLAVETWIAAMSAKGAGASVVVWARPAGRVDSSVH